MFTQLFGQSKKIVSQAIRDPGRLYDRPRDVVYDHRLSRAEKEKILDSWKLDQEALIRAEDEYMLQVKGKNQKSASAMLQEIYEAQDLLRLTN